MKIDVFRGTVLLCLLLAAASLAAPAMGQFSKYSEVPPATPPGEAVPAGPPAAPVGGLNFYTDRGLFTTDFPGLTSEDFTDTNVAPMAIVACPGAFNTNTDNACFSPGAIEPGIEIDNIQGNDNVVLGTGALGVPTPTVGPNTFLDNMVILFNNPGVPVAAFGGELECPIAAGTVNIDIFGASGLLGSTTAICSPGGAFWGVSSDVIIDRIEFDEQAGGGDLIRDVLFGVGPVPTMGEWGLLALILLLVGVSALALHRRHTV